MAVAAAMPSKEVMKTTSQSAKVARPRTPTPEQNQGKPFRPRSEMRLISAAKFVHLEVPRRKNHWGRLIQSNQTGMLFGPRGRGKTWVAMSLHTSARPHQRSDTRWHWLSRAMEMTITIG